LNVVAATGCADPETPVNAHVTRVNNKATVTCNFTSHTWHLVCKDTQWIGRTADCDDGPFITVSSSAAWFQHSALEICCSYGKIRWQVSYNVKSSILVSSARGWATGEWDSCPQPYQNSLPRFA